MKDLDIETLKRDYIFASNPEYIYDKFRQNNTVINLLNVKSTKEIIKQYNAIIQKSEKSLNDVTLAYAMIIALTFLNFTEAKDAIKSIDLSKLKWGKYIKNIFMRNAKSTTTNVIHAKGKALIPKKSETNTSATINSIYL